MLEGPDLDEFIEWWTETMREDEQWIETRWGEGWTEADFQEYWKGLY